MSTFEIKPTSPPDIERCFLHLENCYILNRNPLLSERKSKLRKLAKTLTAFRKEVHKALLDDFQKPVAETDLTEIWPVLSEIRHVNKNLSDWMQENAVDAPLSMIGTSASTVYEPKGVVLIISPWNFPVNLTLGPLVSAIAAGNKVIVKPSENTPHTSVILEKIISEVFTVDEVRVVQGGTDESQQLLKLPFDHIFFTGSPAVGKLVMKAAAQHLTSVTLELGGKSPAIVDETADVKDAAEKIIWGKLINTGQTCVAPDYALIHQSKLNDFLNFAHLAVEKLYSSSVDENKDFGRIVNTKHFDRIVSLIEDAKGKGATVAVEGKAADRFIPPTLLKDVTMDMRVMQDEIFGPVLPVLSFQSLDEALGIVDKNPDPLAAYIFSGNEKNKMKVVNELSAGAIGVNECVIHYAHPNLPFGGTGKSGMGRAHGFAGFEAFSNKKAVLRQKTGFTAMKLFYPPYTVFKQKLINLLLKYL